MEYRRAMGASATALLVALGLGACSDDGGALYIRPFKQTNVELQVNQPFDLEVWLSAKVTDKTYVDVDAATHIAYLQVDEFVVFKAGEDKQFAKIVAIGGTPGQDYLGLTFTLRNGTTAPKTWKYRVKGVNPGPTPDRGMLPPLDQGPTPDTGTVGDQGTASDSGPATDATAAGDQGPAADAAPPSG